MINWWGFGSKKWGARHFSGSKKGVFNTDQDKKVVFTAAHACTGHICECPPRAYAQVKCGMFYFFNYIYIKQIYISR